MHNFWALVKFRKPIQFTIAPEIEMLRYNSNRIIPNAGSAF